MDFRPSDERSKNQVSEWAVRNEKMKEMEVLSINLKSSGLLLVVHLHGGWKMQVVHALKETLLEVPEQKPDDTNRNHPLRYLEYVFSYVCLLAAIRFNQAPKMDTAARAIAKETSK